MRTKRPIIFTLFFAIYLVIVLLTDFSIVGFWTDVILSILLSIFGLRLIFRKVADKLFMSILIKTTNIICSLLVIGLLVVNIINPFALDTLKLRGFYFQNVNGRLFNAYFKPVGAYSGGYGNFWITETPKYFPIIEWRVYWEKSVHHDFNSDTFDGEIIDNKEVVENYIMDNIIDKNK
jgi:hypothetical protein